MTDASCAVTSAPTSSSCGPLELILARLAAENVVPLSHLYCCSCTPGETPACYLVTVSFTSAHSQSEFAVFQFKGDSDDVVRQFPVTTAFTYSLPESRDSQRSTAGVSIHFSFSYKNSSRQKWEYSTASPEEFSKFYDSYSTLEKVIETTDTYLWLSRFGPELNCGQRCRALPLVQNNQQLLNSLLQREPEFTNLQEYKLFVGTWNVNDYQDNLSDIELLTWLRGGSTTGVADIYVIGLQELDRNGLLVGTSRDHSWHQELQKCLEKLGCRFKLVDKKLLGWLLVLVFVRDDLYRNVSEVSSGSYATGFLDMFSNKGAVGVSFLFLDSRIAFVCSHLQDGEGSENREKRSRHFQEIFTGMFFEGGRPNSLLLRPSDMDLIFWLGDLNYRLIDGGSRIEDVKEWAAAGKFQPLLKIDELRTKQKEDPRHALAQFNEADIDFQPTYKYEPGTDLWDSVKSRCPAWTDRILWWTGNHSFKRQLITSHSYTSHMSYTHSDHKPVSGEYSLLVKKVDAVKQKSVRDLVMREWDAAANEAIPRVDLYPTELHFGHVRLFEPQVIQIKICNSGNVGIRFEFKLSKEKAWLRFKPDSAAGVLDVGQTACLTACLMVGAESAGGLASGTELLEHILVLHLPAATPTDIASVRNPGHASSATSGPDKFVQVSATYEPSVFGLPLEVLLHMIRPFSTYSPEEILELRQMSAEGIPAPLLVPKEVWRLVDRVHEAPPRDPFSFSDCGTDAVRIRDALEQGTLIDPVPGSPESAYTMLRCFLRSLPDAVIPSRMADRCLDCAHLRHIAVEFVQTSLPPAHRALFVYLCKFFSDIAKGADLNVAARYCSDLLFPPVSAKREHRAEQEVRQRAIFVKHFLRSPTAGATGVSVASLSLAQ